jgi:two-component system LytT family response regulator
MLRVVIVDDQEIERFHLKVLFKHCPGITVIGECGGIEESAYIINREQPDAIFLDIILADGQSGFDLLPLIETRAKIVFVTTYDEYAVRAFHANALDYLMKPVTLERLCETLVRLNQKNESGMEHSAKRLNSTDLVHLREGGRQGLIPIEQIIAIKSDGDYTRIYTSGNDVFYMRRSMKEWLDMLPAELFTSLDRKLTIGIRTMREIRAEDYTGGVLTLDGSSHRFALGKTALKKARRIMRELG